MTSRKAEVIRKYRALKNIFGKKPRQTIYRISLKPQATPDETSKAQMQFERDLRLWLRDDDAYNKGLVAFVKRGTPSTGGGANTVICCTAEKTAAISEKFGDAIGGIHIGKMEDVLTYKGPRPAQPRP